MGWTSGYLEITETSLADAHVMLFIFLDGENSRRTTDD